MKDFEFEELETSGSMKAQGKTSKNNFTFSSPKQFATKTTQTKMKKPFRPGEFDKVLLKKKIISKWDKKTW